MSDARTRTWLLAARLRDVATIKAFLKDGMDVDAANNGGLTALLRAAAMGYVDVVDVLVGARANVDARDNKGWSVLEAATVYGRA